MLSAYCRYGISFGLNSQPLNVRHFIVPSACYMILFCGGIRFAQEERQIKSGGGDSDVSSEGEGYSNHISCIYLRLS